MFEELQGKKVGVFGVCAEPQQLVDQAVKEWGLRFTCFSDPTHILRNYLDEKGLISIRISGGENSTDSGFYKVHPKIKNYKHGVAQPGVLCVKPDGSKIYTWAIDPSFMNVGGASDRPVPADIWTLVQSKLAGGDMAEVPPPVIRRRGVCSACSIQ